MRPLSAWLCELLSSFRELFVSKADTLKLGGSRGCIPGIPNTRLEDCQEVGPSFREIHFQSVQSKPEQLSTAALGKQCKTPKS